MEKLIDHSFKICYDKNIIAWSDIEVVITSYTGTVVVLHKGPWVRIPLTPPMFKASQCTI